MKNVKISVSTLFIIISQANNVSSSQNHLFVLKWEQVDGSKEASTFTCETKVQEKMTNLYISEQMLVWEESWVGIQQRKKKLYWNYK